MRKITLLTSENRTLNLMLYQFAKLMLTKCSKIKQI